METDAVEERTIIAFDAEYGFDFIVFLAEMGNISFFGNLLQLECLVHV
jgi:hypothetical protein